MHRMFNCLSVILLLLELADYYNSVNIWLLNVDMKHILFDCLFAAMIWTLYTSSILRTHLFNCVLVPLIFITWLMIKACHILLWVHTIIRSS